MVISMISFNPEFKDEKVMEVISHQFPLPTLLKPIFTPQATLHEWLIYSLGQCVLDTPGSPFCFISEVFDNLLQSLDERDQCIVHEIIEELQIKHEELFNDYVFQSICFSNINFYKFSYEQYPNIGRIIFHTDED